MNGISNLLETYGTSLEESRKLLEAVASELKRQKQYTFLQTPQFLTPEQVRALGLTTETGEAFTIPEGWMLKAIPTETEPILSLKAPTGEEVGLEDVFVTSEGEWLTRAQQEARESQVAEWQETIGAVTPKLFPSIYKAIDFAGIIEYAKTNPEDFLARIQKIGPTTETQALLKLMGFTDTDISELLAPVPPMAITDEAKS